MSSPLSFLSSTKTTMVLFLVLAVLLLLSVTLPSPPSPTATSRPDDSSATAKAVWFVLGPGGLATSPVFLSVLGLFFLNLTGVLAARTAVTLGRARVRPPSTPTLQRWADGDNAVSGTSSAPVTPEIVLHVLRGMGFAAVTAGERTAWAVKHRTAPIGFLLFHVSFYLLCLGGLGLFLTRFVGAVTLVEGQEFAGFARVLRSSPWLGPPDLNFRLETVEAALEAGRPLSLEARLWISSRSLTRQATSRVNHPARLGASTILVQSAGIAPTLWLQDRDGFTLDRVAVAAETLRGRGSEVDLAGGVYQVVVRPIIDRSHFPTRSELRATPIGLEVRDRTGSPVFSGTVTVGRPVDLGSAVLVVQDLRFWAGLIVVREYGGSLLITAFVLGITGLVWRLVLFRREVAVRWDGSDFAVAGRAESFRHRFRQELVTIRDLLAHTSAEDAKTGSLPDLGRP